jgi:O-antigen ligase
MTEMGTACAPARLPRTDQWAVPRVRMTHVDEAVLLVLIVLTVGHQLQFLTDYTRVPVRELLYAYLYTRLLTRSRLVATSGQLMLFGFLGLSVFAAVHTLLVFGSAIAGAGFMRWVGVALVALPASYVVRTAGAFRRCFLVWAGMVVIAAGTLLYQLGGGSMEWMVRDWISIRGGALRFRTLLGEANVGGMAAAILFLGAFCFVRGPYFRLLLVTAAGLLVVFSLSKAGILGLALAIAYLAHARVRQFAFSLAIRIPRPRQVVLVAAIAVTIVVGISVVASSSKARLLVTGYSALLLPSLTGGTDNSKALGDDLKDRVGERSKIGWRLMREQGVSLPLNSAMGGGFGFAGSAALQIRGSESHVLLPHNIYLEAFLVGGSLMLAWLLALGALTYRGLKRTVEPDVRRFGVGVLLITLFYGAVYPVTYEPTLAMMFWLSCGWGLARA